MSNPRFIIQEHFARTHHYDFRLEKDGVFKSWVLRKSFTHSPRIRRLAIQVDDHYLGFGNFEGEIPRGRYGAGKIRIWDSGEYIASRWDANKITFQLFGGKVIGRYSLIRFQRAGPHSWLLVKHKE
jgi:bifunctional non-homologous end joining protein LigD